MRMREDRMDLKAHVFYQQVISNVYAIDSITSVFEQTLVEKGLWDPDGERGRALKEVRGGAEPASAEANYNARLLSTFLRHIGYEDAIEYINLARKDKLARQMLQYLNVTKGDPQKIKDLLYKFCEIPAGRFHVSPCITLGIRVDLITQFISDHRPYISVAKNHITMRDAAEIVSRSIGSVSQPGMVGGKAAGMILANRILKPTLAAGDPELAAAIDEPDSYFVKSCVAADYLNRNGLQECHSLKYLDYAAMEKLRQSLLDRFRRGTFPDHVNDKFMEILRKTEGSPLILRSSSYLEDNVGHSFSGKYESVFISNCGAIEDRFEELVWGIKRVYLSLYGAQAIEYRRDKDLLDHNERMAVLIQKVIGSRYGKYFFPSISLVGFSRNAHCWNSRIRKEDGMLRIVMGLGTRAVERVGDDYPRMVSLSEPELRPEVTMAEKIKYSQRYVDVMNLETRQVETHNFVDLVNRLAGENRRIDLREIVSIVEDDMLKTPIVFPDSLEHGKCAITFDGLLKKRKFPELMKRVLKSVESVYGVPVDMEFVLNGGKLYILQCRHLAERAAFEGSVSVPPADDEHILFTARRGFSSAVIKDIEFIVYVDENEYAGLPAADRKFDVARVVGRLNRVLAGKRFILMGPGRWGSSNIDLGVPVRYNDINNALMLIEIARERNGITPEVSYGTHFFQDLVEADIVPLPLYPDSDDVVFNARFFANARNRLADLDSAGAGVENVVKAVNVPMEARGRFLSVYLDEKPPFGAGILQ